MELPKKIGRYEILAELGHGAMGTVYRAKDPSMDRVVALKTIISVVLANDQGGEFRERFYREARAAGGLAHPGIVPVFDVGEHEGQPFLVMEFVDGKTLSDAVRGGQRLTLDRVCEIGQKVAEALGYAHQRGVVHRDIKPANILITSVESHGIARPKITDFGVAKLAAGQTTLTGQMLGTPAYMPPEQFTGAPVDGRADIFSLGVMLYWMATGEQPFPGESMTAVSYKVVHTEPVPPRKLNPSIPARLDSIILTCLQKSPEDRFQTCEELARELGELRTGATSTGLQATAIGARSARSDPEATLVEVAPTIEDPLVASTVRSLRPGQPPTQPASKSNASNRIVMAAVAAVVIVAGGWFLLRSKEKPAAVATTEPAAASGVAVPASAADEPTPAVVEPKPAAPTPAKATASATAPPVAAALPAAKAPKAPTATVPAPGKAAPVPEPAVVDFDPKSLDAKTNGRLKIEADRMPPGLDFSVEMNGKTYFQGTVTGNKTQIDDLYVPPGVQEFRVTAKSGALQKASNTVSVEFKPKKKHTLKVELRTQGAASGKGVPQGLYTDSQVVVTLQ